MAFLKRPFYLGSLKLANNIFYAPLAGCSDFPFRQMTTRYRPGLVFCEMVKMDALVRHDPYTYRFLDYTPDMCPIGAQICGSKKEFAAKSARLIEELGFQVVDLNCGCPVDKVTKDGSGSGLLKTPELIGDILCEMVQAVRIPVTVKIRAGWDSTALNAPDIVEIAEAAGAKAITIHGRTRAQGYQGNADLNVIQECKKRAKSILVIGNGDIFTPERAEKMFQTTHADGILVARGTMGQPWIVEDIIDFLSGNTVRSRTVDDFKEAMSSHFEKILRYQNEKQALIDFRRVGCWYLKRCAGAKSLRVELNRASSTKEALLLMERFDWSALSLICAEALEKGQDTI